MRKEENEREWVKVAIDWNDLSCISQHISDVNECILHKIFIIAQQRKKEEEVREKERAQSCERKKRQIPYFNLT